MRISIAVVLAVSLCGSSVQAQSEPSDSSQQGHSTSISELLEQQMPHGGIETLSDTQGVDVEPYLGQWCELTVTSLLKLTPSNVASLQSGAVSVRLKLLPTGKIMDGGMVLEVRSGEPELDKIAWDAVSNSAYPPLPEGFHGPYLELRWYYVFKSLRTK